MRILAVDVGTGTQDILLFDTDVEPENCLKLVMPSPTVLVANRIRRATEAGRALLLTGVTMGGGPSTWAVEAHHQAGLPTYATPDAARTFNDDLAAVERDLGVVIVGEEDAARLARRDDIVHVEMRDVYYQEICQALAAFDVVPHVDLVAVAVFDHGNAPPDVSDRKFRFDYLRERLSTGDGLAAFAFWREEIPESMTRLQAVARTMPDELPLIVMDTAPAAVLGALEDPQVAAADDKVVVNVGNFHTLAFTMTDGHIAGVFEHHTGLIDRPKLERLIRRLAQGTLTNAELFEDHGHGAIVFTPAERALHLVAVTGPRRGLLRKTTLPVYFAVPHGDMMLAGCFGLVRACAHLAPHYAEHIERALAR
ncbi:MAG: DUF1786 family protein [Ardenticatenia bacterium]|nr:DUF1786 family protein [Ardenticatenia bacterium]